MLKYFKKIFSVVLAAVLLVTATAPSGAIAASKPGRPSFKVVKRAKKSVTLKINKTKKCDWIPDIYCKFKTWQI